VEAEFDFVSVKDGSKVTARSFGEAMDSADKATNKAMSAAYKYTAFQTFCIPTEGDNDADAHTQEVTQAHQPAEPLHNTASHAPARTAPPQRPVPAAQRPIIAGELRVTQAKVAKTGTNAKGPWTLYAVKFSDGREATTFSESMYEAAVEAARDGKAVDVEIQGKNLTSMMAAYTMSPDELQSELV